MQPHASFVLRLDVMSDAPNLRGVLEPDWSQFYTARLQPRDG